MSDERKHQLTRGEFLRSAGLAGLGVLGLGSLAACAPAGEANSSNGSAGDGAGIAWDREVDVLVVGSGTAAMAALTAIGYAPDAKVLVIEKSTVWGGTTATSGAGMWIPLNIAEGEADIEDNRDDALKYMIATTFTRSDSALCEAYIDAGRAFQEFTVETFGWEWEIQNGVRGDYYEPLPGYRSYGRTAGVKGLYGWTLWPLIQETLVERGVEIEFETSAKELITDANGTVIGVIADAGGDETKIKASKGVVLGTGGFDHNNTMMRSFQPVRPLVSNAALGNTGDGQNMGAAIGGALGIMDTNWGLPCFVPGPFTLDFDVDRETVFDVALNDWFSYRGKPNAIVVNKYGKRFGNEASIYAVFNRSFSQWNSDTLLYENVPAYWICDSEYAEYFNLPGQTEKTDPVPEHLVQADTIEDLAAKLGIDAAGLSAEVALWNTDCAAGVDSKFHRGEKAIDYQNSGDNTSGRELANNCLGPVAKPPFYGGYYVPGTCGTNGGLRINTNAQVLNTADEPIAGLYAVGNCSAGVSGGYYSGGGMTVGSGSVMSWVAARHMLDIS
jgi:succinate dehydrogenase/fumarate reductase flavoprotein subunit